MKKKIIAIIVAIVLIIPVSRGWYEFLLDNFFDAELASSTQFKFRKISDTEVEVVGYDSYLHGSITIPEKIRIGLHIYKVTRIGRSAFKGCISLTSINIPDGVTSIADYAFYGCSSLTSINIPEGVTSIADYAFENCDSLEPKLLVYDKGTKCYGWIGDKKKCTEVVIPDGVTSIGASAFYRCISLTSINIPESVTSIGNSAFSYCKSLTSINIPEGVTSIRYSAFSGCESLTSIKIPKSLTSISEGVFRDCSNLEIVIDNSKRNVKVGWDTFKGCKSVKWLK